MDSKKLWETVQLRNAEESKAATAMFRHGEVMQGAYEKAVQRKTRALRKWRKHASIEQNTDFPKFPGSLQ